MTPEIFNALNDPKTEFVLLPNALLKELIVQSEHPAIKKLPPRYKSTMLKLKDGDGLAIGRELVTRYAYDKSTADEKFVLDRCDILVIGNTHVKLASKLVKG